MIGAILIESPKWCDKATTAWTTYKKFKEPTFLVVITGGKYAYTTEDDVNIIHYSL